MKKLFSVFVAVALVMGFAMTASAATSVSVTLTSPTITKAPDACEKAGAITFDFPPGAVLTAGDWWYFDLPEGANLCKNLNYLIVNRGAFAVDTWVGTDTLDPTLVAFSNIGNAFAPGNIFPGGTGPLTVVATGGAAAQTVVAGGNLALRVIGTSGSRRVTIYVADDDPVANTATMTVGLDTVLRIKILDGSANVNTAVLVDSSAIIIDRDGQPFTAINSQASLAATGQYRLFGEKVADTGRPAGKPVAKDEVVDTAAYVVPHVENTLCVNAENAAGNLFVSFASRIDLFTFTGDSQIAHTGSATAITLKTCAGKTASLDEIKIATQNLCTFDYETAGTGGGYCSTHAAGAVYMESIGGFGSIGDLYDIDFQSMTAGVYFGAFPTMKGYLSSEDECKDLGTAVAAATTVFCVGAKCSDTDTTISYPTSNACTVDADEKVSRIFSKGGSITGVQNYEQIKFDFASFHYDTSIIAAGTEADVKITLNKYPCGEIWHDTVTLGTFVTTCTTTTTGKTNLLFPWFPGSQFAGWWSGYVITNGSPSAGTAVITAVDSEGNKATYTTPDAIPAGGHFNATFVDAADWTQVTGTFDGSNNYVVTVSCNFTSGGGMAMLGNSTEGVGYTAYSSGW